MSDTTSTLPIVVPPLPLTQDEILDDKTALYLGKNMGGILSNITYKKMDGLHFAVLDDARSTPLVFRGLFLVDEAFPNLTSSGNIGSPFTAKSPEFAKYTGFLTAVPSKNNDYTWARDDWATVCHNVEAIQGAVNRCAHFQAGASCIHRAGRRDLMKITLALFKKNAMREERGEQPAYTFDKWPMTSTTVPLFERVSRLKRWDINPLPVVDYQQDSWTPVSPSRYEDVVGSLIDLEFNIVYTAMAVKPASNSQPKEGNPVPRPMEGNRQNGRRLIFWAVPTNIRILEKGVSPDMNDLPLIQTGKRRAVSPLDGDAKRQHTGDTSSVNIASPSAAYMDGGSGTVNPKDTVV